jgi:hypothetical protein
MAEGFSLNLSCWWFSRYCNIAEDLKRGTPAVYRTKTPTIYHDTRLQWAGICRLVRDRDPLGAEVTRCVFASFVPQTVLSELPFRLASSLSNFSIFVGLHNFPNTWHLTARPDQCVSVYYQRFQYTVRYQSYFLILPLCLKNSTS